ncbi:hypothetical protein [Chitinophaga qingshengii]|uniref:Outer membrane protein beta-barrel domain-containing protein n=1 Tax=Chitinophaga qingshengii TaxID=1569794 RepID=A0ABR7TYQ1_9BACT|nr:hypothetical protein [Chitinophaga qingshengii]MBC9934888.1 hypothetical protein [Chitinophaga qingshengii]
MKQHYLAGICLSAVLGFTSCTKHIYAPSAANAPLLKEKNEFKASISPYNLHTAYAITNNVAVMANGQYVYQVNAGETNYPSDDLFVNGDLRGGMGELAVGFFKPLDRKKRMVFDVYAGGGMGGFKTLAAGADQEGVNKEDYRLKNRFSKIFIQPSIGFVHRAFEAGFTSRFSCVNFYDTHIGAHAFDNKENAKSDFLRIADKPTVFYEPTFTIRAGYKYVKFQSQLMFSVPIRDNNTLLNYPLNDYFQPVVFTMGVSVNIAHWYDNVIKEKKKY